MGLFNIFKSAPAQPKAKPTGAPVRKVVFSGECSKTFRGYKKLNISYHNIGDCEKNCADFASQVSDNKFAGHIIELVYIVDNNPHIEVTIDGRQVGSIWNSSAYYNELMTSKMSALYFMLEPEIVMQGNKKVERQRPRLFAKFD